MIKLKTDCNECIHVNVCQYKHNAQFAMDKFKTITFKSPISNEVCTWEEKMEYDHINVEFSCPEYEEKQQTLLKRNIKEMEE